MQIERLVRRTAVGGFIVAGGVVFAQAGASAEEAPATSSNSPSAPLKKRVQQETVSKTATATREATVKATTAKGAGTKKTPTKAAPTKKGTLAAVRNAAVTWPVTVSPTPVVAPAATVDVAAAAPATTAVTAVVTDTNATAPTGGSGSPSSDGSIAGVTLAASQTGADTTTAQEVSSTEAVAAGPPPGDAVTSESAVANLAATSTTASTVEAAALTGTSPNGQITITIDEPLPGTVVAPGTPVLVTGTVSVGSGPSNINVIYVIDVSGSTSGFGGACGDPNGDGDADTILDCEIAGLISLNTSLSGSNVDVSIVSFSSGAVIEDLSPAAGDQTTTRPSTDASGNGVPDVVDVLSSLSSGGGTNYDDALAAVQSLLVAGEQNYVFFLSDGDPTDFTTGPGSPLQAIADAGATVLTFAVGAGTSGCAAGVPLSEIAATTGGTCTEVTDPAQLALALTGINVTGIDRVEIEVNGFVGIATLNPLGGFSIVIPAGILQPGRNDIIARAFGSAELTGQVATADTYVIVGNRVVAAGGEDEDEFELLSFDADDEVRAAGGSLAATGSDSRRLAETGALSFLLGGLLVGRARHLRRRRLVRR